MAQHDYVIANGTGAAVRSDLNNALAAIVSQNSGATAPATTYAYQFWADTTTNLLKLRNSANSAWITLFQLDGEWSTLPVENGTAAAPSIYFKDSGTDTGFYSPGTDQVGISTGGTARLTIDANGNLAVDTNTLYVDAPNNRVGIGTSSPSGTLEVGAIAGAVTAGDLIVSTGSTTASVTVGRISSTSSDSTSFRVRNRVNSTIFVVDAPTERVGIGTTPSYTLDVNGQGRFNNDLLIADATATRGRIYGDSTGVTYRAESGLATRFMHVGTELARIDSSGRLLVGTSSNAGNSIFVVQGNTTSTGAGVIDISSGSASPASGTGIGYIRFKDTGSGSSNYQYASIACEVDGTSSSATDLPGRLVFSTTADGASSPTERMRITNAGALSYSPCSGSDLVGNEACGFIGDGAYAPIYKVKTALTSTKYAARFYNGNGEVGNITMNGSATAYNTSSDYRLKENVVAVVDGITRLQQLKPSRFNFKADPTNTVDGFIAHEVQAVVPEAVTGDKDAVDSDGNPKYQGIDQSKLVPLLTAALQEAIGEIASLKARVAALESA